MALYQPQPLPQLRNRGLYGPPLAMTFTRQSLRGKHSCLHPRLPARSAIAESPHPRIGPTCETVSLSGAAHGPKVPHATEPRLLERSGDRVRREAIGHQDDFDLTSAGESTSQRSENHDLKTGPPRVRRRSARRAPRWHPRRPAARLRMPPASVPPNSTCMPRWRWGVRYIFCRYRSTSRR